MIRLPLTITFHVDAAMRAMFRDPVAPNHPLRTVSQLMRKGIDLRLEHHDSGVKR